jgi:hypothetical protein
MGGQAEVYCRDHVIPLIVTLQRYMRYCCVPTHHRAGTRQGRADPIRLVQSCKKQVGYQCLWLKHRRGIRVTPHAGKPAAAVAEEDMATGGILDDDFDDEHHNSGDNREEESLCNTDDKHSDASTTGPEADDAADGSQSSASNLVATKFLVRVLLLSLPMCGIQNRAAARGPLWGAGAAPFNHSDMGNKSRGFSSCYKFGTNVNR